MVKYSIELSVENEVGSLIDEQYIINNFDEALRTKKIKAFFQPIMRTLTGKVCGAEALARWEDPAEGILSPFYFVGILEKHRLIHKLDLAILDSICDTYHMLKEKGAPIVPFSINLSRLDFNEVDMLGEITKLLKKRNVPPNALHIEITESVMLDNTIYFRRLFDSFHDAGFNIYMDDFGSGYSSLNVLKDYQFDVLKIDMRFLSDVGVRSKSILASVVNMAKVIGIHTLAEGVETPEQVQFLRDIGCEMLQGYYYSMPINEEQFYRFITSGRQSIEKPEEGCYWEKVGQINFLSSDPLLEFGASDHTDADEKSYMFMNSAPLALIEYDGRTAVFKYINSAYRRDLLKVGITSENDLELAINDKERPYHQTFFDFIDSASKTDEIRTIDNVMNEGYFTFKVRCIARSGERAMMAAMIYIYDPKNSDDRSDDIQKYSQTLYSTYEFVMMLYPESDYAHRIYSSFGMNHITGEYRLSEGIRYVAERYIHPEDRERYIRFMTDSPERRMTESTQNFIAQPFRLKFTCGEFKWVIIRLTKAYTVSEPKFLLTIQKLDSEAVRHFEKYGTQDII